MNKGLSIDLIKHTINSFSILIGIFNIIRSSRTPFHLNTEIMRFSGQNFKLRFYLISTNILFERDIVYCCITFIQRISGIFSILFTLFFQLVNTTYTNKQKWRQKTNDEYSKKEKKRKTNKTKQHSVSFFFW